MIPDFDAEGLLPAASGPADADVCPYSASMSELIARLGSSPGRQALLKGLLAYRAEFYRIGLFEGYQVLGGSFVEDSERSLGRTPRDLDVLTHLAVPRPLWNQAHIAAALDALSATSAERFGVEGKIHADGYKNPGAILHDVTKAALLFARERSDRFMKGVVSVALDHDADVEALALLSEPSA